ncbi:MAG: GGDEF domain-containing protein [Arenimonas sp.]
MKLSILPSDDALMRMRIKRQLMAFLSYLMFLLPLLYSVYNGWMGFGYRGLALFSITGVLVNVGFFVAIRTGFSRRFHDPSLTFAQIAVSVVLALIMIRFANEARTVLLMLFFSGFFFGVFALTTRQMLALAVATIIGYALVMGQELHANPSEPEVLRLELLRFLTLSMILIWISLLGGYVARMRMKLANAMVRLQALASHDELTGVFNRRHLIDILHREKERADRFGHSFSICILDLDHFKRINDTYGHGTGDEVLREFSERMRTSARKMDWLGRQEVDNTFGRYGGEEFLLVLPHTPLEGARHCVDRIRERVQCSPFKTAAGELEVTFSAGLAEYRKDESVTSALSRADEALYRAKDGGRNRTEV